MIRCNGMDVMCLGSDVFGCEVIHNGEPMSQNYDSVLRSSYKVQLRTTKHYKVLPCTTPYFQILQNISPHHKYDSALPETTSYYKVQLPPTKCVKECCKVQQSTTTEYYSALQCTTLKYFAKYYIEIQSS